MDDSFTGSCSVFYSMIEFIRFGSEVIRIHPIRDDHLYGKDRISLKVVP